MARSPKTAVGGLREACVREALIIIKESGVEALSLRDVARRLEVSHQAPYKHFPSRDHLLAEIVSRAYHDFAAYLDARTQSGNPVEDLGAMGRAYLEYALQYPLYYRLMFGTPLPDPANHPEMMRSARHAFSLLRDCLSRMPLQLVDEPSRLALELDALFVWSTMHGISSILQAHALETLDLPAEVLSGAPEHTLKRIGFALGVETSEEDDLLKPMPVCPT